MGTGVDRIHEKIRSFKRKYYLNLSIRGAILSLAIVLGYFVLATIVEHNLWLGTSFRLLLFTTFFLVVGFCLYQFLREPLSWWIGKRGLTEEESARLIGAKLPTIKDRLLNFIQLSSTNNALAVASLQQKSQEFEPVSFEQVIDIKQNRKHLRFLLIPVVVLISIFIFNKSILTQSTVRLINFSKEYSPEAPFNFILDERALTAFHSEDFILTFGISGSAVPEDVYLIKNDQRFKIGKRSDGKFEYVVENIQDGFDFQLEGAGFFSDPYRVEVYHRPELSQLNIDLEYPRYVGKKNEKLVNAGNLEIPEGTKVTWRLSTQYAESATIDFSNDSVRNDFQAIDDQHLTFGRQIRESIQYEIELKNDRAKNKDGIRYVIDVVKDQHPSISVSNLKDSILYERVLIGGMISDDYGLSHLELRYSIKDENNQGVSAQSIPIAIDKAQNEQSFYLNWVLDSLDVEPGNRLEYYLIVWDNDGINGRKFTKTGIYNFEVPSIENLVTQISESEQRTEQKIEESQGKSKKLQDQIQEAAEKLKGKQNLGWQERKMLDDILQEKTRVEQAIENLKQENQLLNEKKNAFTEQDQKIKEKAEQIQKLMNELLDEETKKLFEELQELLKENAEMNDLQKLMNKLNQNTQNLEKELERTLSLFKELKFDFKMEQTIQQLNKAVEAQENLNKQTEQLEKDQSGERQKNNNEEGKETLKTESEKLAKEQEEVKKQVQQAEQHLKDAQEIGEELHKDTGIEKNENFDSIEEEQEKSQEQLQNNQPSKAKTPQKQSIEKMKSMSSKLKEAQSGMEMEMNMENLEALRNIVHGLVKLSFDEEQLMKEFADLNQSDPRFNVIAQRQIKLRDDLKVIEDSLVALSKRDPFMGTIINKEVGELNTHLENVITANKERRRPQASSEMQASMTSINNLALLLDNHFEMMMEAMKKAKSGPGKNKQKSPSLSQMQQQLNEKIQQLKGSGKSGRQLSEELAKLAAEQERIRKALQEMEKKIPDGKMPGGLDGKMEQTETELVNKQLTDQLIRRQKEILTRLLESEKSMREQEMEEERKGETAKDYDKEIPKAFEEYLRLKEKEVELLKTVPPRLYPYYKKEVGEYFRRMGKQ